MPVIGGMVTTVGTIVMWIGMAVVLMMALSVITGNANLLGGFVRVLASLLSGMAELVVGLGRIFGGIVGAVPPRAWAVIVGVALIAFVIHQLGVWTLVVLGILGASVSAALTVERIRS